MHLAETRKEALDQARLGAGRYQREYFERTMGRAQMIDGPLDKVIDGMVERGAWIVGTPDDCVAGIERLAEQSGGFGGFLVQTVDWAPREAMLHSYELLARYVMPQFQGSAVGTAASNTWAYRSPRRAHGWAHAGHRPRPPVLRPAACRFISRAGLLLSLDGTNA